MNFITTAYLEKKNFMFFFELTGVIEARETVFYQYLNRTRKTFFKSEVLCRKFIGLPP